MVYRRDCGQDGHGCYYAKSTQTGAKGRAAAYQHDVIHKWLFSEQEPQQIRALMAEGRTRSPFRVDPLLRSLTPDVIGPVSSALQPEEPRGDVDCRMVRQVRLPGMAYGNGFQQTISRQNAAAEQRIRAAKNAASVSAEELPTGPGRRSHGRNSGCFLGAFPPAGGRCWHARNNGVYCMRDRMAREEAVESLV